jgi:hypothetical protein
VAPNLPDPAASAAVLLGSSTFRDTHLDALPGVANNVADLAAILVDTELLGLPTQRVCTLLDCADTSELIGQLSQLAADTLDTFIVYYSGHGLLSREGDLILATPAARADLPKYTGLPYACLRDIVDRCRATRRIVILDCCFSGRALRAMSDTATAIIGQVDADGIYVLTSAPATSPSVAPQHARNTAFTGGLLRVLSRGIPGANELLSLDDVYDHTLMAMARHGWPRPQRFGTNTIGRFGLLRNRAWCRTPAPIPTEPLADPGRHRRLAEGVRDALAVVAPTLGPTGQDGLDALHRAFPLHDADSSAGAGAGEASEREAGIALVRETMLAMREQYGDGATTAAVILGVLVDGLQTLLESGSEPGRLDAAVSVETARIAHQLLTNARSASDAPSLSPSLDELSAAVRTALGEQEVADAVVAAARSVGAGNVEVVPASAGEHPATSSTLESSTFVLDSKVLAPNGAVGPIALDDPFVLASTDGEIDTRALLAAAGSSRPAILIIAPRVSTFAVRALLHAFSQVVVVRPTDPALDLTALQNRLDPGGAGSGWSRARRSLVLPTATTIDRPAADLELSRNRVTLNVTDRTDQDHMVVAVRALAVARSVADAGVVLGAGAALRAAAEFRESDTTQDPVTVLVRAAASEPYRRLKLTIERGGDGRGRAGRDPADPEDLAVDSLATVRGALAHAAATASRYLAKA